MQKLIKGLTLLSFITLISGFVAYRSGAFDQPKVAGSKNIMFADTPPIKKEMMSSSKSMILMSPKNSTITPKDTSKKKEIMHSSKSGKIVEPIDFKKDLIMSSSKSGEIIFPEKDTAKKKPE